MKLGLGLIFSQASGKETSQWMSGILLSRPRLLCLSTPLRLPRYFTGTLWFLLKDEEFVSKTINDSNIDLDKFSTSKVRQLAKMMESSKTTARHIKQVASDPQVAQINFMSHQHTDLPPSKHKKKKSFVKPRPPSHKNDASDRQQVPSYHTNDSKKNSDAKNVYKNKAGCQKCGDSIHIECFQCPAKKYQCKSCHKYEHFTSFCYQKKHVSFKPGNQRPICY